MRTRTRYSSREAAAIMRLLRHRVGASREQQKADRNELRTRYGFWISEFRVGFTDTDFAAKVDAGVFMIVD